MKFSIAVGTIFLFTMLAFNMPKQAQADFHNDLIRGIAGAVIIDQLNRNNNRASPRSSDASSNRTNAPRGDSRVAQIQQFLNDLGFDAGVVDGVSGAGTRRAISSYQTSRGLQPTGTFSASQFIALRADHARAQSPGQGSVLLRDEVIAAQTFLGQLGYAVGGADGQWGPRSQRALDEYRISRGLAVQPGIDPRDLASLTTAVIGGANPAPAGIDNQPTEISVAPTQAAATSAAVIDTSQYVHIGSLRPISEFEWVGRYIALQMLQADPSLLDNPSNADRWFRTEVLSDQYGNNPNLGQAYLAGNNLIREDIFANFIASSPEIYGAVPPVSPENPLRLAVYDWINFQDFEEGKGLPIRFDPIFQTDYEIAHLQTRLQIVARANGTDYLPVSREEAKIWVDRARDPRRALTQVFWGRVEGIGQDETLTAFATQADGNLRMPSTFVLERVTLHYQSKSRQETPRIDPEILFEWTIDSTNAALAIAGSGLESAQNIGLEIRNGHVFPGVLSGTHSLNFVAATPRTRGDNYQTRRTLLRLLALTKLSIDPDWAREGTIFAGLAYLFFDDAKFVSYFGPNAIAMRRQPPPNRMIDPNFGSRYFRDEFAASRAKESFFENDFLQIQSQATRWPMPVMNAVRLNLGQYDVSQQAFPIQGGGNYASTHAYRVALLAGGQDWITSADWIGNLPQMLEIPFDEAEQLSISMGNDRSIYLAWTSELDMTQDGSRMEAVGPSNLMNNTQIRSGRATLKTIGFYRDSELTQLLLSLDPASVITTPDIDIDAAMAAQDLVSIPLLSAKAMLAQAFDAIAEPSLVDQMLENTGVVQSANEFTVAEARRQAREEYDAIPREDAGWIEAQVLVGPYDTVNGTFRIAEVERYRYQTSTGYQADFRFQLTRPLEGLELVVPFEQARSIVEQSGRRLTVRFSSRAVKFTNATQPNRGPSVIADIEPGEMFFYRQNPAGQIEIVASIDAKDAAATTAGATYDASDFDAFSQMSVLYDPHISDLLSLKYGQVDITAEALDGMMLNASRSFDSGANHLGPQFFEDFPTNATATQRAAVSDSFASWITAKATAMGPQLTIRALLRNPGNCQLGYIHTASRLDRTERFSGIFADYPVEADYNAVRSGLATASGPTVFVERGYLTSYGGINPATGYCEAGSGLFSRGISQDLFILNGAILRAGSDLDRNEIAEDIDITINDVDLDKVGDISGLRVTGDVTAVRYLNQNLDILREIPGGLPQNHALVIAQTPMGPTLESVDTIGASTEPTHAPEMPNMIQSVVDERQATQPLSTFDLLGVKTGQSFDEAEAMLRSELDVLAEFTSFSTEAPDSKFGAIRVLITEDASQSITMFGPTPDGPVIAVSRVVTNNDGTWPSDAIVSSLDEKYESNMQLADSARSVWWHQDATSIQNACPRLPITYPDDRFFNLDLVNGSPQGVNWLDLVSYTPAPKPEDELNMQNRGRCGSFVQLELLDTQLGGKTGAFAVFLYDPGVASILTVPRAPESEEAGLGIKF